MSRVDQQICVRCVMDRSDPDLEFDEAGVCAYCRQYDTLIASEAYNPATRETQLDALVAEIKRRGRGRRYDCVVGLSGGVDSSYAAYQAKKLGLRPVAVHVDNGWNSELAVKNIEGIVRKLDIDLVTHVIDWPQFRAAQLSLIRASVVDIEMVTDHTIVAAMYHLARTQRVGFILTGDNVATEATLPRTWNHRKTDLTNLRAIHRRYGGGSPLSTLPQLSTVAMVLHQRVLGIRYVPLLSYVPYVKSEAIATLQRELEWRPYGGKHYESIFTRFYQGYILPTKFGVDKRRLHFSRLICSGQMTRDEALAQLTQSPYDPALLASDRDFVLKKLGLSEQEFARIMAEPPRRHEDFASDEGVLQFLFRARGSLRSLRQRVLG